jgi:type IV secretory pathway TrbL component
MNRAGGIFVDCSRNGREAEHGSRGRGENAMFTFLLWCLLLVVCWPLALIAAVLYPIVWLFLLPFRLVGIAVHGALELVAAIIFLPVRVLRAI